MDVTVRQLAVKDVFTLARIAVKLDLKPKGEEESTMEYGQKLIARALESCEDDALAWLADMVGMTKEEFAQQPAVMIFDVLPAIASQDGARDFFGRLSQYLRASSSSDSDGPTTPSSD